MDPFSRSESANLVYTLEQIDSHQEIPLQCDLIPESLVSSAILQQIQIQSHNLTYDAEIIRQWLNFCYSEHTECRKTKLQGHFPDYYEIILIDTEGFQLVETSTRFSYIALSMSGVQSLS
jgi:hypothetical protein